MDGYSEILNGYREQGRFRHIPGQAPEELLDLSSNDYLALGSEPRYAREFLEHLTQGRFTSSASRLLASQQQEYSALEGWLSEAYGKSALLFNSGYHANVGCMSSLSIPGTAILSDKLVHASIIDGIRLGGAPCRRFRHNDMESLRRELRKLSETARRIIVVVESIYSMDGDIAPLQQIVELKREFPQMLLYVDEAHALGVRGATGLGVCQEMGVMDDVDIIIGTFGKACASVGAFVATSALIRDFLINNARSFIFSTSLPPINVAYTLFMLKQIAHLTDNRTKLDEVSDYFANSLQEVSGQQRISHSQIVPLMVGDNARVLELSAYLRTHGVLALPIRKPTVPLGTERIRFSLSSALTHQQIDHVMELIGGFRV